ncbi:unnamed protein product [Phaeothamnion confervicola]
MLRAGHRRAFIQAHVLEACPDHISSLGVAAAFGSIASTVEAMLLCPKAFSARHFTLPVRFVVGNALPSFAAQTFSLESAATPMVGREVLGLSSHSPKPLRRVLAAALRGGRVLVCTGASLGVLLQVILDAREGARRYDAAAAAGKVPPTAGMLGARGGIIVRICGPAGLRPASDFGGARHTLEQARSPVLLPVVIGGGGSPLSSNSSTSSGFESRRDSAFFAVALHELLDIAAWKRLEPEPAWRLFPKSSVYSDHHDDGSGGRDGGGGDDGITVNPGDKNRAGSGIFLVEADALSSGQPSLLLEPPIAAGAPNAASFSGGCGCGSVLQSGLQLAEAACALRMVEVLLAGAVGDGTATSAAALDASVSKGERTSASSADNKSSGAGFSGGVRAESSPPALVRVLLVDVARAMAGTGAGMAASNGRGDGDAPPAEVVIDARAALVLAITSWAGATLPSSMHRTDPPQQEAGAEGMRAAETATAAPNSGAANGGVGDDVGGGDDGSGGAGIAVGPDSMSHGEATSDKAAADPLLVFGRLLRTRIEAAIPPAATAAPGGALAAAGAFCRRTLFGTARLAPPLQPPLLVYDTDSQASFDWLADVMGSQGWEVVPQPPPLSVQGGGAGGATAAAAAASPPILVHYANDVRTMEAAAAHHARRRRLVSKEGAAAAEATAADASAVPAVCAVFHSSPAAASAPMLCPSLWRGTQDSSLVLCMEHMGEDLFDFARARLLDGTPVPDLQAELDDLFAAAATAIAAVDASRDGGGRGRVGI